MKMADVKIHEIIQLIEEERPSGVKQLALLLCQRYGVSNRQALEMIMKLQKRGRIEFMSQPLTASTDLAAYLRTGQSLWYWVTVGLSTITLFAVFFIPKSLIPWSYIRNVMGVVFVLWFPGYTLVKALFPYKLPLRVVGDKLAEVERIALSLGVSLTLVPLVVLLLNYSSLGIGEFVISFSLFVIVVVFATIAVVREFHAKIRF